MNDKIDTKYNNWILSITLGKKEISKLEKHNIKGLKMFNDDEYLCKKGSLPRN